MIIGNTCLYGATGGELFALGRAGERFAVRNSGVHAVVEGAGDHCCEYMTGGVVIVLGNTGRNIAAGMTGGIAFLLDEDNEATNRVNHEIVEICPITTHKQEEIIKSLLESHIQATQSIKAKTIIQHWSNWKTKFKILVPPSEKDKLGMFTKQEVTS